MFINTLFGVIRRSRLKICSDLQNSLSISAGFVSYLVAIFFNAILTLPKIPNVSNRMMDPESARIHVHQPKYFLNSQNVQQGALVTFLYQNFLENQHNATQWHKKWKTTTVDFFGCYFLLTVWFNSQSMKGLKLTILNYCVRKMQCSKKKP